MIGVYKLYCSLLVHDSICFIDDGCPGLCVYLISVGNVDGMFCFSLKTVEVFFQLFSAQASQMFKKLITTWIIPSILDGEVGYLSIT